MNDLDEIILESVGDADNIISRIGVIYAHLAKFVYLPPTAMSNSWVNTIYEQSKELSIRCKRTNEWNKAESMFYTKMKPKAEKEFTKDNDPDAFEIAFNIVLQYWNSIHQFKDAGPDIRDYIINCANRARRVDISNYIKGKDWVRFSR